MRAFNDRGSVRMRARVGDGTRPGVVSLPHGFWPSLLPGGSSGNALTPDGLSDLGGGGDFLDARVEVERQSSDVAGLMAVGEARATRYSKRSSTGKVQPGRAGAASASSPRR